MSHSAQGPPAFAGVAGRGWALLRAPALGMQGLRKGSQSYWLLRV